MGRPVPPKPNKGNGSSTGVRGGKIQKQRKKHRVVIESAGAKDDDNLQVVLSFHAEPPPGYTFIPAGNTQLTAAMKVFAKNGGHKIMAVSATPHAQRHELSREVHRIGYHFPTEVVAQVCSHYGIRLDSSGRLIGEQDSEKLFMKISQKGEVVLNETIRDQVTINTEAKEIIRDLFPRIPDNDLFQIIKTAFQLGTNKVGTAEEIPLVRRAQLSVVAHIRHSYTNYDKLLRQVPYNEARHMVEKTTLRKLVEWRGDENDKDEQSRKAVDDAVREIVVLSDEDESESELEEGQVLENDDAKAEPSRKPARPTVVTEHRPISPGELSSGEEAPQGYRFVPHPARRTQVMQTEPEYVARQRSRYAIWDQVRQEYQMGVPTCEPARIITRIPLDDTIPLRQVPVSREMVYEPLPSVRYGREEAQPVSLFPFPYSLSKMLRLPPGEVTNTSKARLIRAQSPQTVFRTPDGRLYEQVAPQENTTRRIYTPPVLLNQNPTQGRRSASPRRQRTDHHRRTPSMQDDGSIVQSIEPADSAFKSPIVPQNGFGHQARGERELQRRVQDRKQQLIDLTSSAEQATERMRLSPSASSPFVQRSRQDFRNANMTDENAPPRHRQLIDLDSLIPKPPPSYHNDERTYVEPRGQIVYDRPTRYVYNDNQASMRNTVERQYHQNHVPVDSNLRQVIYEKFDDRQPYQQSVRYVDNTHPAAYAGRVGHVSYGRADYSQPLPPAQGLSAYPDAVPVRRIVLDSGGPMEGVLRTADSRYPPAYRSTFTQH